MVIVCWCNRDNEIVQQVFMFIAATDKFWPCCLDYSASYVRNICSYIQIRNASRSREQCAACHVPKKLELHV